jgi:putative DNA methylase
MHKWWARRLGSVFRSICLYTLVDNPEEINVKDPGNGTKISDFSDDNNRLKDIFEQISLKNPDPLWNLYPKDVQIADKKVLDPFMGGGTSIVEASRFGAECHGVDLNPVAWFVTKKEIDAGSTDISELEDSFEQIEKQLKKELKRYYKTPCPNDPDDHKADVMNSFWVKQLDCVSCGEQISLFKDYRIGNGRFENKGRYNVYCPECEKITLVEDWRGESVCEHCQNEFVPQDGPVSGGNYTCRSCGQKYGITDAIQEQSGFELKYHSVEYHCPVCEDRGYEGIKVKGYKTAKNYDKTLFEEAKEEWEQRTELHDYVPDEDIRPGWKTASSQFEGNAPGAGDIEPHGYEKWVDMFNEREMLCFSQILRGIDSIDNQNAQEFLLLAFSDMLRYRSIMNTYKLSSNQLNHIFKTNSFDPPTRPAEGNVWGAEYGTGTFESIWKMVERGVKWANKPTERHIEYPNSDKYPSVPRNRSISSPETIETEIFNTPVGKNTNISQGDMKNITAENEYDAVITDPPYYDNVMYSELSDFFYVWQKILLEDKYEAFQDDATPRAESIVANPAEEKDEEVFESEMLEAFSVIHKALKEDGVLAFTYHHAESESWAELLASICDAGFEVTATYPITADVSKFVDGESVEFDIVVVARPVDEREPTSWDRLRRQIVRTAKETRKTLEEQRELSGGDIGVIEMGKCFQEYSKHHGEIRGSREGMTAREVVDEIYGIIQGGSRGEQDIYIDLLEWGSPTYDSLNKHLKRSDASEETMKDMKLIRIGDGKLTLLDWRDEKRQAYVQDEVHEWNGDLTNLDKIHFLRYRFEEGKSTREYLERWDTDELQELCEGIAEATNDETYLKMVGVDTSLTEFGED